MAKNTTNSQSAKNKKEAVEKVSSDTQKATTSAKKSTSTKKGDSANSKTTKNSITKKFDYSSSDLLCFFPKKLSDTLVISTVQPNYKLSFSNNVATIYIEKEDFNITLNTSSVQVSNNNTNNMLLVSYSDSKYTITTNNQLEVSNSIQISQISRNKEFIEVQILADDLDLFIKNDIIYFEEDGDSTETVEINKKALPKTKEITPKQKPGKSIIRDNDTLIISDTSKTVTLPYTISELEEKLKKNKHYSNLQDVIDNEYTIPLDNFKNPVKSRFKEAYQLIKKREHGSLKEAVELGLELMFQSDLNPAIIAACKDLDELDIYLDCLDDNELDKFSCFKILYNIPPTKNKKM